MEIKSFTVESLDAKLSSVIEPTEDQNRRLRELMKVFLKENRKLNLSAYREEGQCWVGNVVDSVSGACVLEKLGRSKFTMTNDPAFAPASAGRQGNTQFPKDLSVIDVGMGGGFPLLPLAIMLPDVKFTGLDATGKKVDAVRRICKKMKIKNVKLITGRAEELGHDKKLREKFDVVLGRAVAPLSVLLEYMSPFAAIKGHLLCWKSMNIEDELTDSINARIKLNAQLVDKVEYELPVDWGKRQILVFEKTGELASDFPRSVGIAKKEPI